MKNLRWFLPSLALAALLGNGCIITSTQVLANFALTNPVPILPGTPVWREYVDLNTVKDYADNRDKIKGLSDIAVVGKFVNQAGSPAGSVEIWITAGNTNLTTVPGVHASATLLWGPVGVDAGPSTKSINWNDSAKLFNAPGKQILIDAMKGSGVFTAYIFASGAGGNTIDIQNGAIILVIAAGV
jgi:hypothetical protein